MKRLVSLTLLALVTLSSPSSAAVIPYYDLTAFKDSAGSWDLIDFETVGGGATPTDHADIGSYSALGVTFGTGNRFTDDFLGPVSGRWGWLSNNLTGSDKVFEFSISGAGVRAVGVHNVLNSGVPKGAHMSAYGVGNLLLGAACTHDDGQTKDFFGLCRTRTSCGSRSP